MSDIEAISKEFHNTLCHYKNNRDRILLKAINNVRSCNGAHLALTQERRSKIIWYRRTKNFIQIILAILTFILILAIYEMLLLRRYNRANIFGGCTLSFIWPFDECPVAY